MKRKDIIKELERLNIDFSKKSNTKALSRKLEKAEIFRGVKAFRLLPDGQLQTGGVGGSIETFFEEGETYSVSDENEIQLCSHGFHFYKEGNACFGADLFEENTVLHEITAYGNVISDTEKCVAKTIKIGKKIILKLDGNFNSGFLNSGSYNSGHYNSGDSNSGNWNSGHSNSGSFNTEEAEFINIFNKPCELKIWKNIRKPKFLYFERRDSETYKEAFQRSWKNTTKEDKKLLEKLPNFDWEIFTKISGIVKPK